MTMSWKSGALGALIAAGAVATGAAAVSAADAALALKQRQAVMSSIGAHMGGIKGGLAAGNGEVVEAHAKAINGLATVIPSFFPPGSDKGKTRAKPEIWQKWSEFEAVNAKLVEESGKLAEVAKGGDKAAMAAQFGKMGKEGCGACHKPFRTEK
ncbi:MAG: cytochrome c [Alphaproteobacteria bacterium]|nr:cytochrome c [Alphaproteobacteria bacterium]